MERWGLVNWPVRNEISAFITTRVRSLPCPRLPSLGHPRAKYPTRSATGHLSNVKIIQMYDAVSDHICYTGRSLDRTADITSIAVRQT